MVIARIIAGYALFLVFSASTCQPGNIIPNRKLDLANGEELKFLSRFGHKPDHILHVGAHEGQEAVFYRNQGVKNVTWIEADPSKISALRKNVEPFGHRAIEALCAEQDGQIVEFYRASNDGHSSSMLLPKEHLKHFPNVAFEQKISLTTKTLATLAAEHSLPPVDFLLLDVQGAELSVLKGLTQQMLETINFMFLEISKVEMYQGQVLFPQLDSWLEERGFECVAGCETQWVHTNALYARKTLISPQKLASNG